MRNFGMSMLWFWIGYIVVTLIGIGHTVFNITVRHMKSMKDGPGMGEGYEKTKPWHPLYNIVIFSLCGWLYLRGLENSAFPDALMTGAIWAGICIVFDVFGWVLIRHPWSLTFQEFYVDYQPWITLIYLAIFLGPLVGYCICLL